MRGVFEDLPGGGPPSTVVLQAHEVPSYRVVSDDDQPLRVYRPRPAFVQLSLRFVAGLQMAIGGFFRFFAAILMALSFLLCLVFAALYLLLDYQSGLQLGVGTGVVALCCFTFCFVTGYLEGLFESWIAKGDPVV